jgi:signal transduction histidine kinase
MNLILPQLLELSCEESNKLLADLVKPLDPRLSLAARIGWLSGVLSVLFSLLAGFYVGTLAQATIEREIGTLYADRAQHIADAIDLKIQASVSTLRLASGFLAELPQGDDSGVKQNLINIIKKDTGGTVWTAVADRSGKVLAGDGGLLEGSSLAGQDWFSAALQGVSVTGPLSFPALEDALAPLPAGGSHNFLFVTSPIASDSGAPTGVAVACFDMSWIDAIQRLASESLVGSRPVDIFLLAGDGRVLSQLLEGAPPPESDLSDRIGTAMKSVASGVSLGSLTTDNYLVGFARSRKAGGAFNPGWTIVVREARQSAFLPASQTALAIGLASLALGLALSLAAALGTRFVLRGLTKIAASSDSLRTGAAQEFAALDGKDEVARISRSLAALFTGLKTSNTQLADLNRDLDRKVTERTQEVRRLSDEMKNAAVTRERLRMSRDLHDTLAHSMLAMLTQIRMMRKIQKSKPELLEEELGHAETAAKEGLKIAREAVTDLRYFAVRDDGLGEALAKLIKRLKERVEVDACLEVDDALSALAGPMAETIYRIAEEALHNIDRHAGAGKVEVKAALDQTDPANHVLTLTITDNGKGFDSKVQPRGHFGLVGMREQAEIAGGKLTIESKAGKGTTVRLVARL